MWFISIIFNGVCKYFMKIDDYLEVSTIRLDGIGSNWIFDKTKTIMVLSLPITFKIIVFYKNQC
jgi:hypothetical protein